MVQAMQSATWRLQPVRWILAVGVVAMVLAACGASVPSGVPVRGETTDGPLVLGLDLTRDAWSVGEVIEGTATLRVQDAATTLWGSGGGLIGFEFADSTGTYRMQSAWRLDCIAHSLAPGSPATSDIWMSGAWDGAAPAQQFAIDGKARLPAGEWDITAVAVFGIDGCGSDRTMRTTVRIHVIDPASG
jgi:hypothetical protein